MTTLRLPPGKSTEWETPQEFFDELDREFHFSLDVCATARNTKVSLFLSKDDDALSATWGAHVCWMNPPYGRELPRWIEKAYVESRVRGATIVALLPARTDTRWFHNYVLPHAEIRYVKGRLTFRDPDGVDASRPFAWPLMIAIFRGERGVESLA